jgi:diadenosine tetraphosphate (Ap4A) HIT family hydrolase
MQFGNQIIMHEGVIIRSALSFAFVNFKPFVPGHVLVSSIRPVPRVAELRPDELADLWLVARKVGVNVGESPCLRDRLTGGTGRGGNPGTARRPCSTVHHPGASRAGTCVWKKREKESHSFELSFCQDGPDAGQTISVSARGSCSGGRYLLWALSEPVAPSRKRQILCGSPRQQVHIHVMPRHAKDREVLDIKVTGD